jgi:hypothetical protein
VKKLLLVLAFLLTAIALQAQPTTTIRYHFGDDPDGKLGWANPNFDDSAWPASQSGQWPIPALFSNGFMWVRTRVLVQRDAEGPLAIHLLNASFPLADEILVNGVSVGKQGSFPPRVRYTRETVFDLPAGLTAPGATAVVAFRVWYPPITHRESVALASAGFVLDGSRSLHQADRADHINALLWAGPELAINLVIVMLGFGLLVFWRWVGGRSLLICAGVLIGDTAYFLVNALFALGVLPGTWLTFSLLVTTIQFFNRFL